MISYHKVSKVYFATWGSVDTQKKLTEIKNDSKRCAFEEGGNFFETSQKKSTQN